VSRTVLITVGRMPKGLDLARGFAAEGCRVVVADPYRWHVARLSRAVAATHRTVAPAREPDRYLEQLSDIVARERVELVVPVSEETMHVVRLGDRLPAGTRLFAGPAALVHTLHDKWRFNRLAAARESSSSSTAPPCRRRARRAPPSCSSAWTARTSAPARWPSGGACSAPRCTAAW